MKKTRNTVADMLAMKGKRQISMLCVDNLDEGAGGERRRYRYAVDR